MPNKNKDTSGQPSGIDQHKLWLIIGIGLAVVLVLVAVFLVRKEVVGKGISQHSFTKLTQNFK